MRLGLERLEDRTVPSNFTAATVSDLIADINAANLAGGSNTVTLVAGNRFTLTDGDNVDGYGQLNGLPVIAGDLAIIGNGDIIERSTAKRTLPFRLFAVGGSLTMSDLTLQGGLTFGSPYPAIGGAIYNQGALTLHGVTVQNNTALGGDAIRGSHAEGSAAFGGGIYSVGVLTLEGCTVRNNMAIGGQGDDGFSDYGFFFYPGRKGGNAWGGGLFCVGGTVSINGTSFTGNSAKGGTGGTGLKGLSSGGDGGGAFGGGLYLDVATLTMHNTTVTMNVADGGKGGNSSGGQPQGNPGAGIGGGIYIDPTVSAGLDAFTVGHFQHNHASTSNDDIFGSYDLIS
jgi:hypothetical protein